MKKLLTLLAVSAAIFSSAALATGTVTPPPPPPLPPPASSQGQEQTQGQGQTQGQEQTANGGNAASEANGGNSEAKGGGGGRATSGPSTSYSALNNDINYSSRMQHLSLAPPVWTQVPQANGCIVSGSTAWSAVFGAASYSGSKQASDAVCTMVNMASAAQASCQYRTASLINRRVFESLNPGTSGEFFEQGVHLNLSPVDCANLIRPRLIMDARPPLVQPVAVNVSPTIGGSSGQCTSTATTRRSPTNVVRKPKFASVCR